MEVEIGSFVETYKARFENQGEIVKRLGKLNRKQACMTVDYYIS